MRRICSIEKESFRHLKWLFGLLCNDVCNPRCDFQGISEVVEFLVYLLWGKFVAMAAIGHLKNIF